MTAAIARRARAVTAGLVGAALVAACGDQVGGEETVVVDATRPPVNLVPEGYDGRFRTVGTVLESPEHGAQLCHAVAESLPPQCGGSDVVGWDWDAVDAESVDGTTWGTYVVVGTFDGETFTLTEPAVVDDGTVESPAAHDAGFSTPCPAPAGGWKPVDPERATDSALDAATRRARAAVGFGGLWIDQQIPADEISEENANDPRRLVLNVTTTEAVAALERDLREVWGGSLCVAQAARSEAELSSVQEELPDLPGQLGSGTEARTGQVVVDLLVATEERQRELDAEFGSGTVRLHGALVPID
jgi:hypothetical protein